MQAPRKPHRLRYLAAGALLAVAGVLVDPDALSASVFRSSWFYTRPLLGELRLALFLLGASIAALPALLAVLRRDAPDPEPPARLTRGVDLAFALVLILAGLAALVHEDPITKDTKFYLGEGLDIASQGGVLQLVRRCFEGTWLEDNRQPLYLAAIAPFAEPSNRFLDAARLVALGGSVATLLACLRACRRRGGEAAAMIGGTLLVTNGAFVEGGATVACESWWTAFAVLAFDGATRAGGSRPGWRWAGVGACLGLAFLTKGTGTLLLVATSAWIVWNERRRALHAFWPMLAAFALVSAPLLTRNLRVFGDPLWNSTSRRVFWLDSWAQYFDPAAMREASASHYLATHSVADIAARLASGLVKQGVHLLESCAPWSPRAGLGAPLLVALAACLVLQRDRRVRSFLLLVCGLWIVCFAWYAPVASDQRFLAVLLPIAMPLVAPVAARLTGRERFVARVACWTLIAALAAASLARGALTHGALAFRAGRFEESPWNAPVRELLRERTRGTSDAIYLLGPSAHFGFDWDRTLLATRQPLPEDDAGLAAVLAASRGAQVRFLVVEHPGWRRRVGDDWMRAAEPPNGWSRIAGFPAEDPQVVVFERQ